MGRRLLADLKENDHYTADPLFTVQRKRLVTGIDPDYASNVGWLDEDYKLVTDRREIDRLDAYYGEHDEMPDGYTLTGYAEEWEHIDTYLTPQAARARIANESDMRVYVESAYRNHEMKLIRSLLICLASAPDAAEVNSFQWPVMPPSKGQSPVLFEDGYAEGWAKCLEECQRAVALTASPEPPCSAAEKEASHG